ncbi:ABC transporter permease subunit [Saccharopolyspora phatthalungensis]|uniref:Putative spermidine/putrescine transport system permease protein n=1 Tax=Saccharopolyspora phatthalungensis TaxID=664693 RepID=A0A840QH05_9PSEU|nr:ABC transporter permease subunit [Saccharopolyspora phatthalungensis]MBB5159391.1 putative spermidine/putrescine transport system permease protein [Saccharopolyspora phatthalungensis]
MTAPPQIHVAVKPGLGRSLRGNWLWLCLPAGLLIVVVYLLPLGVLLVESFTTPSVGLDNYRAVFENFGYVRTILRTLGISAMATVLSLLLGYPLAHVMVTASPRWQKFLLLCVITPYVTSVLVRSFAWQVILGRQGLLNKLSEALGLGTHDLLFSPFAVAVGLTHYVLPLMILPLTSVMRQVPRNLVPAAESLGAGPATAWVRIYLPQTKPGIEAGVVLCFVYGVGAFVIPAILGGNSGAMLGVTIQGAIAQRADYGFAAAAATLLVICVLLVVAFYKWRFGGSLETLAAPRNTARSGAAIPGRTSSGRLVRLLAVLVRPLDTSGLSRAGWILKAYSLVVGLLLLLPQFIAIPVSLSSSRAMVVPPPGWSLQWYRNLADPSWWAPIVTSLQVAAVVAVLATTLGTLAALGVSRSGLSRLGGLANTLMLMPLLFPTVVAAAAMFVAFLPLYLTDTRTGLILAHTALALPFAFVVVLASARKLDTKLDQAAASLGARARQRLTRVVLPLLRPSIIVALFLTFMNSFDETPVAIFVTGVRVSTLPVQMYDSLTIQSDPTIAAAAVVIMALAGLGIGLAPRLAAAGRRTSRKGGTK